MDELLIAEFLKEKFPELGTETALQYALELVEITSLYDYLDPHE